MEDPSARGGGQFGFQGGNTKIGVQKCEMKEQTQAENSHKEVFPIVRWTLKCGQSLRGRARDTDINL